MLLAAGTLLLAACVPPPPDPSGGGDGGGSGVGPEILGFDACTAPSTSSMGSWLESPYRIVGIYVGGANRGCSQPNLTKSWVTTVAGQGWRYLPIYVGLQAPCNVHTNVAKFDTDPGTAASQGYAAGNDAADSATALGLGPGNPIYYDMEHYSRDPNTPEGQACITAVLTFTSAFVDQLHARGYGAGFYSSGSSGITDEVNAYKQQLGYHVPDALWFAHWNDVASCYNTPWIPDDLWVSHQRHHQYHGGHDETWGSVTINIDNDISDGATAGP
jgi:hypothetical protein